MIGRFLIANVGSTMKSQCCCDGCNSATNQSK